MNRLLSGLILALLPQMATALTITIVNNDGSGVGFRDTSAPSGTQSGATSRGDERLRLVQRAAELWSQQIGGNTSVRVRARFGTPLPCSSSGAVLGQAGPSEIIRDRTGLPAGTFYPVALAEAIVGGNLQSNPTDEEIVMDLNPSIDAGCLSGTVGFSYAIGVADSDGSNRIRLLPVVMHELAHGLGFLSLACTQSGGCNFGSAGTAPLGGYPQGIPDVWSDFQRVGTSGGLWRNLTNTQRASSMTSDQLIWDGPKVGVSRPNFLPTNASGLIDGCIKLHAPSSLQPGSSISHWSSQTSPDLLMEPALTASIGRQQVDLTPSLLEDIGWTLSSGAAPTITTTTTMLSTNPATVVVGQPYTVNGRVSNPSGVCASPRRTLSISDGTSTCQANIAVSTGNASCQLTTFNAGNRTLTGTFAAGGSFSASSGTRTLNVARATTTTVIGSVTPSSSVVGQAVTISVAVNVQAPGSGTPGASVTVSSGNDGEACTFVLPANSCQISFNSTGLRFLTATYAGDANYQGSISSQGAVSIGRGSSTISPAAITPSPSVVGQPITVSATVSAAAPASGTPTGVVTVSASANESCSYTLPATSCQLTLISTGTRTLSYSYAGNTNFLNASATRTQTVNRASTAVSNITDLPDPSELGQPVTVSWQLAAVAPGGGTPSGTVRVSASPSEFCTASLPTTTCELILSTAGNRTLTVAYEGSSDHAPSSANVAHLVTDNERVFRDGFEGTD
ncbi:MAG: Ig-like domain-containing protein [Xanthomonadales bacterium]|jgi:hypothetical protein|nr:Ig-like domain-containing protein [Xanthomonadales bacterium]